MHTELDTLRWALSVKMLQTLWVKQTLGGQPPVQLYNMEGVKFCKKFFRSVPDSKNIVVFCWDRGLGQNVFDRVAAEAAQSPQVKAFICERGLCDSHWKFTGARVKIKADRVNAHVNLWEPRRRHVASVSTFVKPMRLFTSTDAFLAELFPVAINALETGAYVNPACCWPNGSEEDDWPDNLSDDWGYETGWRQRVRERKR